MRFARTGMRWLFGLIFVTAGINHFRDPALYVRMVPTYLPWHRELVYISGVFEVLLGGLLLMPRSQRLAAWGLIALLLAVFPANVHMALHPAEFPTIPPAVLWVRLPLQGVLIAWAYWFTRALTPRPPGPATGQSRPPRS
jgi:uncharacterized membrane protein